MAPRPARATPPRATPTTAPPPAPPPPRPRARPTNPTPFPPSSSCPTDCSSTSSPDPQGHERDRPHLLHRPDGRRHPDGEQEGPHQPARQGRLPQAAVRPAAVPEPHG